MAYVVTDNCINCRYSECVESCPVDCFHLGPNFMVINPDECIDCGKCVYECPVEAIKSDDELEGEQVQFIQLNAKLSKQWPNVTNSTGALPDADQWSSAKGKSITQVDQT